MSFFRKSKGLLCLQIIKIHFFLERCTGKDSSVLVMKLLLFLIDVNGLVSSSNIILHANHTITIFEKLYTHKWKWYDWTLWLVYC